MKARTLLLLFLGAIAMPAFAQLQDKAKLDSYFNAIEANNKYMGSVSISQNGKTIYSRSLGFTDVEAGKKINENSKFRIGSISKMFTAAMIFKAAEENKLKLTDNIGSYFPTVPNASKITIANLLNHHSGIHNFTNDEDYTSWMTTAKTEAEMVAIITKGGSDFEPGSQGDYSNSNYVLLSYILEKIYKKPFKEILTEKIVKPLGLKNTYYGGKINTANNEAYSYGYSGNWEKEPETDMSVPMGAGAILSTPTDLSRFIEALFAGKIISMTSLEQMKTLQDTYGMGMFQFPFEEKTSYGHTGGIDGFKSMLSYSPDDKLTFSMTSNGTNMNNNDIAIAVLSWVYNKPFDIPDFTTFANTTEDLDKYLGTYTSPEVPIALTITKKGTTLMAQGSGQPSFPLDATAKNMFKFDIAGVELEFKPETNQMILKQGGGTFTFTKQ
jgi:D-alanyl-D-alanine carboxypeptidase